jgi:DNA-binding MarR family transcriptional regulator
MDVKTDGQGSNRGLVTLLMQLSKALNRRSSEEALGMRLKWYGALGYVRDHDGLSQSDLETAMYMDANQVVLLLNELEAAQYLVRRRDPQDRRRHIVELTAAGRRALERADKAREGLEGELLAALSVDERTTLRRLVERALESMAQAPVEARS